MATMAFIIGFLQPTNWVKKITPSLFNAYTKNTIFVHVKATFVSHKQFIT